MQGLKFGDMQSRSRSLEFFFTVCGLCVPMLVILTWYEAKIAAAKFKEMPDVQELILTPAFTNLFLVIVSLWCALSLMGLVAATVNNKAVLNMYAKVQMIAIFGCIIASFIFLLKWLKFSGASNIGVSTYYE